MRRSILAFLATVAAIFTFSTTSASAQDDVAGSVEAICCGTGCCLIDSQCFMNGDANPTDECQTCDVSSSQTAWTDVAGCGGTDAGPSGGTDAGPGDTDDGGCSASPGQSGSPLGALALGLAAATLLSIRRRRR